jgi:hypothetical protein
MPLYSKDASAGVDGIHRSDMSDGEGHRATRVSIGNSSQSAVTYQLFIAIQEQNKTMETGAEAEVLLRQECLQTYRGPLPAPKAMSRWAPLVN